MAMQKHASSIMRSVFLQTSNEHPEVISHA